MGIGFVILIHLIAIFILAFVIAVISGIITYFISNNQKKKRKIFLALFIPFQVLFTTYFLSLIGCGIVANIKNVDIGIGDSWYASLNESCQILLIDNVDEAFLECNGQSIMSNITHIQQIDNAVYAELISHEYFYYNLNNNQFETYSDINHFKNETNIHDLNLMKTLTFYHNRRMEVAGIEMKVALILSILLTVVMAVIFCKLILHGYKLGFKKKHKLISCKL